MVEITKDFIKLIGLVILILIIFYVISGEFLVNAFGILTYAEPLTLMNHLSAAITSVSSAPGEASTSFETSGMPYILEIYQYEGRFYLAIDLTLVNETNIEYLKEIKPIPLLSDCEIVEQKLILQEGIVQKITVKKVIEDDKCKVFIETKEVSTVFEIHVNPETGQATRDSSISTTVEVRLIGEKIAPEPVELEATGEPEGVSISFSKTKADPTFFSTMTINVDSTTKLGIYYILIKGSTEAMTEYATYELKIYSEEPEKDCDYLCKSLDYESGDCKPISTEPPSGFTLKGTNIPANQLVSVSSTYPKQYWAFPEEDYAWKILQDLGVNAIQVWGGIEGNVLHIQANENHPWGMNDDSDWAENLESFLAKADSYGMKVVFHEMGNQYGTSFGVVPPMHNYRPVSPYSSLDNAIAVIDKLGGNNNLGKNFFEDERVLWWTPINEARLDADEVRNWLIPVLQRIKYYSGKTSVCVNDKTGRSYAEAFPYITPIIGDYIDYLQAHRYQELVIRSITNQGPQADMYQPAYEAFSADFQLMIDGRGEFGIDELALTEFGTGFDEWEYHYGTDITTIEQQADYIRAAFDAAQDKGITKLFWFNPIQIHSDYNTFGFIEYDGTIIDETYNAFKSAEIKDGESSYSYHEFPERFHGINIMPTNQRWRGHDIKAELERIKSWGFNAIRFHGMNWDMLTPKRHDVIDEAYFNEKKNEHGGITVDEWIEICTELKLYIMLDIHYFGTYWADCPDWAFDGNKPSNREAWDLMMRGDADEELESIKNIWVYVAKRYADNPYVIMNIFNEPRVLEGSDLSQNVIANNYKAFHEELIRDVRAVENVKHLIVIEFYTGLNIPDNIVGDDHVYRDFHWYDPWEKPYSHSQYENIKSEFKRRVGLLSTTGLKVQIGEFGRVLYPQPHEGSEEWFRDSFNIMQEQGINDWYYFAHPGFVLSTESYGFLDENGNPIEPYFSMVIEETKKGIETQTYVKTTQATDTGACDPGEKPISGGCKEGLICCCKPRTQHTTGQGLSVIPGSIYKEYILNIAEEGTNHWRVTSPEATDEGAQQHLPNPVMQINIADLDGAIKAEMLINRWGGHSGTKGKKIRFNNNQWIYLPELKTTTTTPQNYMYQDNPVFEIPLGHLHEGVNTLEGSAEGTGWPQWGWMSVIVRIYYGSDKPHPTGQITSPLSGKNLGENPTITAQAQSTVGIEKVDFLAYYEGYDENGDGYYKDWHHGYFNLRSGDTAVKISGHVGSDSSAPYQVTWDTKYVPDQQAESVKLLARIKDKNGVWYVTPYVESLSLDRSNSLVKLYKAYNVPENYCVRDYKKKSNKVKITDDLSKAESATIHLRTWNGQDSFHNGYNRINGHNFQVGGMNHDYKYSIVNIPLSNLKQDENIIEFYSTTEHHCLEVLWPGPGIIIRYSESLAPPQPPQQTKDMVEISLTTTNSHSDPYLGVDLSATFTHQNSGKQITVNGFWDGGKNWKIRFAPTIPGVWTYTTTSNDNQLDGKTGSFEYVEPSAADKVANPNYRGFLKVSSNKRYLTYADGAPFFWMGGTIWRGNRDTMSYATDFKTYVDNRKSKGFTVIQILLGHPIKDDSVNENGPLFTQKYNLINPANFQNFDLRIKYILDKGMVPVIFIAWGEDLKDMSLNDLKNYYEYTVARYQAYNVVWCISGEYNYVGDLNKIRSLGNTVHNTDSMEHLTTAHPGPTSQATTTTANFLGESWIDVHMQQTWHVNERNLMITDYNKNDGPVINGEAGYENLWEHDRDRVRKEAWTVYMSGGAGYTYGANGVWNWGNPDEPVKGLDAIHWPGSTDMKYVVNLFSGTQWWKMTPHDELVNRGYCLAEKGNQYAVYLTEGGSVTIDLRDRSETFNVKWFNPRTGENISRGTTNGGNYRQFTAPFSGDAVLYIYK